MVARKRQTQVESFLNNYINKREKQGDRAKNQLYKYVVYKYLVKEWIEVCVCVKPEFMYGHVCYKLKNSLGEYDGIRVVRWSWW